MIMNTNGKVFLSKTVTSSENINVGSLPAGNYYIRLFNKTSTITIPFIKAN